MSDTRKISRLSDTREGGATPSNPETRSLSSLHVPDHTLLRCIGSGSYGEVWLSRNVMGVYRAVKVVFRETFRDVRPYEREFNGIRLYEPVSRTHDELIDILHVGRDDQAGYFYYVMELADDETTGQTIDPEHYQPRTLGSEMVRQGRLPFEECLRLALSLSGGLGHLHRKGLIHRDLKPSNIVFVHGIAKIADIGLVAEAGSARSFVGTEGFMPPEGPGTIQADLYSLGKVLYEISSGKDRKTYPQLPTALEETNDLRGYLELNEVILRACEDQPARRYTSADAMHADLLLLKAGKSVRRLHQLESRLARLKRMALVGLGVALLGGAVYYQISREIHLATERRQRQAGQMVARGTRLMEEGDLMGSLPWYVGALALDARDPSRADTHRTRIAAVLERSPALARHWIHGTHVNAATVSHNGRWCALAERDGTASVWDLAGGDSPHWRLSRTNELECVAFRRDDRFLAAGGNGGFRVWELGREQPSLDVELEKTTVYGIEFSPAGDRILTAGYVKLNDGTFDGRVDLWDAVTGECVLPYLVRGNAPLRDASFSHDGRRIVVGGELPDANDPRYTREGWAQVWDLETRSPVSPPVVHGGEGWVYDVDFSPDSRTYVTASLDQTARICDVTSGQVLKTFEHPAGVRTARFSADGRYLVTAGWDFATRVWDVATGELAIPLLKDDAKHLMHAVFVEEGRQVVTVSATSGIGLWDLTANVGLPPTDTRVFSRTGERVASLSNATIVVRAIAADQPEVGPFVPPFQTERMKFSRAGTGLLVYSPSDPKAGAESRLGQVWMLDEAAPSTKPFQCDDGITNATISDDGRWLSSWSGTNGLEVRDLSAGSTPRPRLLMERPIQMAEFNHAANRLAVASASQVTIWDLPPGPAPRLPIECEDRVAHFEFSPDDRRIVIACESDGTVHERAAHVYDTETGQELLPPLGHGDGVFYAEFSPDGRTILTAGEDCQVRLWDAQTGRFLFQLDHPNQVFMARFSRDARWIVTVCRDQRTRVWDAEMAEPITPPLEQPWPAGAAWFLDGSRGVVAQRGDGQTVVWQLPRDPRPLSELFILARMLSGRQISQAGDTPTQPREALLAEWRRLRTASPDSSDSLSRIVNWHRYQAESSESSRLWDAAQFHWTRLEAIDPDNPEWTKRAGAARGQQQSASRP